MKTVKRVGCIALAFVLALSIFLVTLLCFMLIADARVDATMRFIPSYAKIDLSDILSKEQFSDEDYATLYAQTGLSRTAVDGMKNDPQRILKFQEAFFYDGDLEHVAAAITTSHDRFVGGYTAPIVDLQNGDVIVTSACHTYGWQNGHSAIVTDAASQTVLESVTLGRPSSNTRGGTYFFRNSPNFIVLRLKDADEAKRAQIAKTAYERLYNVTYSVTVGILSPKDQGVDPQATHCSHLVWQAFFYYGYDIDSDGGPVCSSRDIAGCDLFEVIQVFGFDPETLW